MKVKPDIFTLLRTGHFHFALTGLGYCLTFVLTSGICYKIIFFNLRGAQGLFRKKCAVFKKIKEKKI
jgi:hypothetical protein